MSCVVSAMRLKPTAKNAIAGSASLNSLMTKAGIGDPSILCNCVVSASMGNLASAIELHADDAFAHRGLQRRVVALSLVGVGKRELAHPLVELVLLAEIAADCPWVARLGMRSRQRPAARTGVDRKHLGIEGFNQY